MAGAFLLAALAVRAEDLADFGAALAPTGADALDAAFAAAWAFMASAATSFMAAPAMFWNCCVSEPHQAIGSTTGLSAAPFDWALDFG